MMSVVWIRLGYEATTINDRLSVHFYGVSHDHEFHRVKRYIRAILSIELRESECMHQSTACFNTLYDILPCRLYLALRFF